jgi:acyl carrier protein
MRECRYCGKENEHAARHCSACGTDLSQTRVNWFRWSNKSERQERLDYVFAGRQPLDDLQLWEGCFKQLGVGLEIVVAVRFIFSSVLKADLSRIRDTDDFSRELAFVWDMDSLARAEIMQGIENHFRIRISEAEAETMKTLKDIVLGIHAKLPSRAPKF